MEFITQMGDDVFTFEALPDRGIGFTFISDGNQIDFGVRFYLPFHLTISLMFFSFSFDWTTKEEREEMRKYFNSHSNTR